MNSSETLIASGIVVTILFVIGAGFARCSMGVSGEDQVEAETQARKFVQAMGLKTSGVACAKTDSDGDGYVSCTAALVMADGSTKLEAIECARVMTINEGCRMQKPGVTVHGR